MSLQILKLNAICGVEQVYKCFEVSGCLDAIEVLLQEHPNAEIRDKCVQIVEMYSELTEQDQQATQALLGQQNQELCGHSIPEKFVI